MHSIHLLLVWLLVMKECVASPVPESPPVHVVIAASRQTDRSILPNARGAMVERDRDNGELKYLLRSIAKNAPWVERIFLLMNPVVGIKKPEEHWWIPEPKKTVIVDRCTLLDDDDCPTRNGLAVMTVVHKIPDLSERFIYTDDDNLLTQPAEVSDFFDGGLPRYWETGVGTDLYDNLAATQLSLEQVPKRFSTSHSWHALTKSACAKLEGDYPKWFAFVRSHKLGRYSSKLNEAGTSASEKANAYMEENLCGVWPWALHKYGLGSTIKSGRQIPLGDNRIGLYDESTWKQFVADPRFIQNVNDDLSQDDPVLYLKQHAIMVKYLDLLFPDAGTGQVLIRGESRNDQKQALAVDSRSEIGEVPLSEELSGKATAKVIDTYNPWRARAVGSHGEIEEPSRKVTAKGIETARDNADEGDGQGGEHGGHLANYGKDGDEQLIEAMIMAGSWRKAVILLKTAAL